MGRHHYWRCSIAPGVITCPTFDQLMSFSSFTSFCWWDVGKKIGIKLFAHYFMRTGTLRWYFSSVNKLWISWGVCHPFCFWFPLYLALEKVLLLSACWNLNSCHLSDCILNIVNLLLNDSGRNSVTKCYFVNVPYDKITVDVYSLKHSFHGWCSLLSWIIWALVYCDCFVTHGSWLG